MKNVLGFTEQYYTLWEKSEAYKKFGAGMVLNGVFTGSYEVVVDYFYIQNLSKDYDKAVAKIKKISKEKGMKWEEDLDLRGEGGWTFSKVLSKGDTFEPWQFTFGKLWGEDIRKSEDVWQLNRAYNEERPRQRIFARRRLLELGELIRHDWVKIETETQVLIDANHSRATDNDYIYVNKEIKKKYMPKLQYQRMKEKEAEDVLQGHFFANGQRIQLRIKGVGGFSFETMYGLTYVEKYITEDGKMLKYMGSSLPDLGREEFVDVLATIKHDEYKGVKETKLQRIKILLSTTKQ